MTYCIGWKTINDIFMVADSAVTFTKHCTTNLSHTSFGELKVNCKDTEISEAITKIHGIDNKLIIGYSGDIDNALKCIEYIRGLVGSEVFNINVTLQNICENTEIIDNVTLIVGFIDFGIAQLYKVQNDYVEVIDTLVETGSIPPSHDFSKKIKWMINEGCRKITYDGEINLTNREILPAIIITAQCYSISCRLLEKYGVGGAFYGASLTKQGFKRNKNISYLITNKSPSLITNQSPYKYEVAGIDFSDFIITNWVEDVLILSSTYLNRPVALFDSFDYETNKCILDALEYSSQKEMFSVNTEQFVLFNPFTEMITVIDVRKEIYNNIFKLWSKYENDFVHYFIVFNIGIINIINFAQFDDEDEVFLNWLLVTPGNYMIRKDFLISTGVEKKIEDWNDEGYV